VALERRFGPAFLASLATHAALAALALFAMRSVAAPSRGTTPAADSRPIRLVWLNQRGPGGGGGGGGNRMVEPLRRAELPGKHARTVPSAKPATIDPATQAQSDREAIQRLIIPVETLASGTETLPGAMDALPAPPSGSQGPGRDGGAGTRIGSGDGPGRGPGFGDGADGGTGGDVYRPGGDVTMPIEIRKGLAQYTTEAMRARAQGAITVECVVQANGVCTNIRVVHAFHPPFGLDQEAVKAAAQWRFRPGMRRGRPVPVLVTMEIAFALR
jgi:protein TonB